MRKGESFRVFADSKQAWREAASVLKASLCEGSQFRRFKRPQRKRTRGRKKQAERGQMKRAEGRRALAC